MLSDTKRCIDPYSPTRAAASAAAASAAAAAAACCSASAAASLDDSSSCAKAKGVEVARRTANTTNQYNLSFNDRTMLNVTYVILHRFGDNKQNSHEIEF